MTRARQERVVALLSREGGWLTAAALADAIGVTPRSIRSYVTAVNSRAPGGDVIVSGAQGYRIDPDAAARLPDTTEHATPRDRLHRLVRDLLDAPDGIDLEAVARQQHVSAATVDADLNRVRALLAGEGGAEAAGIRPADALTLERRGDVVRLRGSEAAQRRLLSRLVHDEVDASALDMTMLRRALSGEHVAADALAAFKNALVDDLAGAGYYVNEVGMTDVLLHVAIAVDRTARHRMIDAETDRAADAGVAAIVERLTAEHLGVEVGPLEAAHLAALLLTRVVGRDRPDARERLDPAVEEAVRDAVARTASEFDVDLVHEDFIVRLALHTQNLLHRARSGAWSRNPLTRSIKSAYPMVFELAVFLAHRLQEHLSFALQEDELAYIAMHVGGRLERSRRADAIVTATIVCPGYYELHELLRSSVDRSLGDAIEVVSVSTRTDPEWGALHTDLVLTTVTPPVVTDRIVVVPPFLTDADLERVRAAAVRVRRARRLARLRADLEQYFSADAFVRGLDPTDDEEAVIRRLGARLQRQDVIDEHYITATVERERLSSTAFTDALAVPHALTMTARRTAIAVAVSPQSVPWGDSRVQVVAMVAFSESDRAAFQTVFEQLVEVFSERESVQRIVRRSVDFGGFLDELVAVIDG